MMNAATNVVQTTIPYTDMPIEPLTALISGMMDVLLDGACPSSTRTPHPTTHPCRRAGTADGEEEGGEEGEEEDDDDDDPGDGDAAHGPVRRPEEDDDNSGGAARHCSLAPLPLPRPPTPPLPTHAHTRPTTLRRAGSTQVAVASPRRR